MVIVSLCWGRCISRVCGGCRCIGRVFVGVCVVVVSLCCDRLVVVYLWWV